VSQYNQESSMDSSRLIRLFIVLWTGILTADAGAFAQSRFLYGMYATGWGENEGIFWTGSSFGVRTGPGGTRLMNFWSDSLGMNTFFVHTSNFPAGGEDNAPYINFLYRDYAAYPGPGRNFIRESKIIPIYNCFQLTRAGESHYLKFSPASQQEGNIIDFDRSTFVVTTGDTSFTVSARTAQAAGPLIHDLIVTGGENRQLRPRDWNTRGTLAFFKLRLRFDSPRAGNSLTVNLTNKASRTGRRNHQLILKTLSISTGNSEAVLPFTLDLSDGEARYEGYVCRLGLRVLCTMPSGGSFQLRDITAYDDSGRVVVEETERFFNTPQRRALDKAFADIASGIAGSPASPKVFPIISLADEPHVGNYAPIDALCKHLLQVDRRLTFYSTWPDDELRHSNRNTISRFARIRLQYVAPNHYLFRTDILDHRQSVYRDYDVLSQFCSLLRKADSTKKIISVPPLFSSGGDLRAPTQYEILSSAYLSLLVGAKGVVYYYSGPFVGDDQPLYSFHDPAGPFDRMFSLRNMHSEKVAALRAFGRFINMHSGEPGGMSNGDLISTYGVDRYGIVGTTDGRDIVNARTYAANEMGNRAKAEISSITLVDGNGTMLEGGNIVGAAHLADRQSSPSVSYFLFANLHASEADVRLKVTLRSSNSRGSLRVTNLTYPDVLANRTIPNPGSVVITLPAHAALILKIE
jgi:hypothetical protein